MKFTITFKDPDGVYDSLRDAARQAVPEGLDDEEREDLIATRREKLTEAIEPWVQYDEYISIEFDTEAGTATVLRNK